MIAYYHGTPSGETAFKANNFWVFWGNIPSREEKAVSAQYSLQSC
jgi:hypothetical protein